MRFTEQQIQSLRLKVKERLSEKRYIHTLGVEEMAVEIGKACLPERIDELRAAALLHDISKEYSEAEHLNVAKRHNIIMSDEDMAAPALWHSITAGAVVSEDFPEYATSDVLSAVVNHTVGSWDMSTFDSIILLADYIEAGRKYQNCVSLRETFLHELSLSKDAEDSIRALDRAVFVSLDNNLKEFISRGADYHSRTKATRDAILAKTERQNNGN